MHANVHNGVMVQKVMVAAIRSGRVGPCQTIWEELRVEQVTHNGATAGSTWFVPRLDISFDKTRQQQQYQ